MCLLCTRSKIFNIRQNKMVFFNNEGMMLNLQLKLDSIIFDNYIETFNELILLLREC